MNLKIGVNDDTTKYVYDEDQDGKILAEGFKYRDEADWWIQCHSVPQRVILTADKSEYDTKFFEDPETGAKKEIKRAQLGAIDPLALTRLAEAAGMGAEKYSPLNYMKGYPWSLSFNAMMRHALAFWGGEDLDPESGLPHVVHAAWHGLALTSFFERGLGEDDRYTTVRELWNTKTQD